MPRDERRKLCNRLLEYVDTITNAMCKAKALARVQKVITELDRAQLQQNNANEAELIATNLHTVDTTIGQLENMRDRLRVQDRLNQSSCEILSNRQAAQLSEDIQNALPSDKENDSPYDSVAPEALDADERAAEWAKTARSSSDPPPEADQINQMLEEEAEKRQQRQSRKRKTFMVDRLQTTHVPAPDPASAESDIS